MFDCSPVISKCKGECCCIIPIEKSFYEKNLDKRTRRVGEIQDLGPAIIPVTEDLKCCYLRTDNFKCNIYEDRPMVCRIYGVSDNPLMKCKYIESSGKIRSKKNRKKTEKEIDIIYEDKLRKIKIANKELSTGRVIDK